MSRSDVRALRCTLEVLPVARTVEFVAFEPPVAAIFLDWPQGPGEIRKDAGGRPTVLYAAPARWLISNPDVTADTLIDAVVAARMGVAVEVEGKWSLMSLSGPGAARLLSASFDVAAVLDSRACVAVTMFDCPAIIALTDRFWIWTKSSYAAALLAAIDRLT